LDGGKDRDGADPGGAFGSLQVVAAVGLLDSDQAAGFVDLLPLQGAQFALAEAGAEREVEVANPTQVRLAGLQRIGRREGDQRCSDRTRMVVRELLPDE